MFFCALNCFAAPPLPPSRCLPNINFHSLSLSHAATLSISYLETQFEDVLLCECVCVFGTSSLHYFHLFILLSLSLSLSPIPLHSYAFSGPPPPLQCEMSDSAPNTPGLSSAPKKYYRHAAHR